MIALSLINDTKPLVWCKEKQRQCYYACPQHSMADGRNICKINQGEPLSQYAMAPEEASA